MEAPPLPVGQYRVIVADPPWDLDLPPLHGDTETLKYPTMSFEEIKALPIKDIAAPDSWLFLWSVQKYLEKSFDVVRAWGFDYKFMMAWIKDHGPQIQGRPQSNIEFVLVGRRGKAQFLSTVDFKMGFLGKKKRAHSFKPKEFYATLARVTEGPRVDLFSRRTIPGFDTWGKESERGG